ncbi:DinB family protein [Lederbergia wuyishanensis]|uniref:Damage-inducible protein DinB n=1 Tax=Lederbergia wuyishanensis TaxID=1347903 RepID=A0ABU0D302_9BACI|nr:DinB family protein [Lederbergia wuyishanensis]MCJ8007068.1 DinB family protein [Lederbergia wuyishanensis]MDQ0342788.1 putative damage-inducible protein DinB [Lederbergia wuyishanensis]
MNPDKIIADYGQFSSWLNTLEGMEETLWLKPITEGKWSISEIIAHIMNWDHHLLTEVLPAVRNEKGIEFPDFDSFNKKASEYATSGISKSKLLEETRDSREQLIKELNEMPIEILTKHLPTNGVTHCPHTGIPYSLIYIVKEFTDHDHHHIRQITQFLNENNKD